MLPPCEKPGSSFIQKSQMPISAPAVQHKLPKPGRSQQSSASFPVPLPVLVTPACRPTHSRGLGVASLGNPGLAYLQKEASLKEHQIDGRFRVSGGHDSVLAASGKNKAWLMDGSASTVCEEDMDSLGCFSRQTTEIGSIAWNRQATDDSVFNQDGPPPESAHEVPMSSGGMRASGSLDSLPNERNKNKFYRTKMCVFSSAGTCRRSGICSFAHTIDQLRPLPKLLKTKMCRARESGGCRDPSCKFAHNLSELRAEATQVALAAPSDQLQQRQQGCSQSHPGSMRKPQTSGLNGEVQTASLHDRIWSSSKQAVDGDHARRAASSAELGKCTSTKQGPAGQGNPVGQGKEQLKRDLWTTAELPLGIGCCVKNTFLSWGPFEDDLESQHETGKGNHRRALSAPVQARTAVHARLRLDESHEQLKCFADEVHWLRSQFSPKAVTASMPQFG
mmetsp:Transcript_66423/g.130961  ORF Transcript_66423/g.130961 Transcript_66423/m.130961 type:complete len:448 (-) Transcript_66423:150-1493(-)